MTIRKAVVALAIGLSLTSACGSGDDASEDADSEAMCAADEAWIAAEEAAFAAFDAGDSDTADRLVSTDVRDAFVSWREALVEAGISDEVADYVAEVEVWFSAAEERGADGYSSASEKSSEAGDVAFSFFYDWKDENCAEPRRDG